MCGCLSRAPIGDLTCNPGMCPDWESNRRPFDSQAGTQSTEPHQPGQTQLFLIEWFKERLSSSIREKPTKDAFLLLKKNPS